MGNASWAADVEACGSPSSVIHQHVTWDVLSMPSYFLCCISKAWASEAPLSGEGWPLPG